MIIIKISFIVPCYISGTMVNHSQRQPCNFYPIILSILLSFVPITQHVLEVGLKSRFVSQWVQYSFHYTTAVSHECISEDKFWRIYRIPCYTVVNYIQQKTPRENNIYEWILTAQHLKYRKIQLATEMFLTWSSLQANFMWR